jgi:Holliday junction resolvase-like predicted endonuclease
MISEIKGKISSTGSNLSDRLEDKLTGDFFGALRYLPFEQGLKGILEQVNFAEEGEQEVWGKFLAAQNGFQVDYKFWPKHAKGEIDLLLEFEDALIGIEVKYRSGISSEDEGEVLNYAESLHQLSKYSHMIENLANDSQAYLIFLSPFSIQHSVQQQLRIGFNVSSSVSLGFANWEDIHTKLIRMRKSALPGTQEYILTDAEELLEVKGLKRFAGFKNLLGSEAIQYTPFTYEKLEELQKASWTLSDLQLEKESEAYVYNAN